MRSAQSLMPANALGVVTIAIGFEAVGADCQVLVFVDIATAVTVSAIAKKIPIGIVSRLSSPIGFNGRGYDGAMIQFCTAICKPQLPCGRLKIVKRCSVADQLHDAG